MKTQSLGLSSIRSYSALNYIHNESVWFMVICMYQPKSFHYEFAFKRCCAFQFSLYMKTTLWEPMDTQIPIFWEVPHLVGMFCIFLYLGLHLEYHSIKVIERNWSTLMWYLIDRKRESRKERKKTAMESNLWKVVWYQGSESKDTAFSLISTNDNLVFACLLVIYRLNIVNYLDCKSGGFY